MVSRRSGATRCSINVGADDDGARGGSRREPGRLGSLEVVLDPDAVWMAPTAGGKILAEVDTDYLKLRTQRDELVAAAAAHVDDRAGLDLPRDRRRSGVYVWLPDHAVQRIDEVFGPRPTTIGGGQAVANVRGVGHEGTGTGTVDRRGSSSRSRRRGSDQSRSKPGSRDELHACRREIGNIERRGGVREAGARGMRIGLERVAGDAARPDRRDHAIELGEPGQSVAMGDERRIGFLEQRPPERQSSLDHRRRRPSPCTPRFMLVS